MNVTSDGDRSGAVPVVAGAAPRPVARAGAPCVVPLEPFGVRDLFRGALASVRLNPAVMIGLTAAIIALLSVLSAAALLPLAIPDTGAHVGNAPDDDARGVLLRLGLGSSYTMAATVAALIGTWMIGGLITVAVARGVLGRQTDLPTAWRAARPRLPALIALGALELGMILLALVVGLAVAIVFAVLTGPELAAYFAVVMIVATILAYVAMLPVFAMSSSAVMLEGRGAYAGLQRAVALQRTGYWRLVGVVGLANLGVVAVSSAIEAPFTLASRAIAEGDEYSNASSMLLAVLGSALAYTVTLPFLVAVHTLVYVDQRMRTEGLAPTLQRVAADPATVNVEDVWSR